MHSRVPSASRRGFSSLVFALILAVGCLSSLAPFSAAAFADDAVQQSPRNQNLNPLPRDRKQGDSAKNSEKAGNALPSADKDPSGESEAKPEPMPESEPTPSEEPKPETKPEPQPNAEAQPPAQEEQNDRWLRGLRQGGRSPGGFQRNHETVLAAFQTVVSQASAATVEVQCDGKPVALGTVVDPEGLIVTKASELTGDSIACKFKDGRELSARVVREHKQLDIVLLKVEAKDLTAVAWRTGDAPMVGSWLASSGLSDRPIAVGVVSVMPRRILPEGGLLGVLLEESDKGPRVQQVMPDSAALKAGVQVNDVIVQVNDAETKNREILIDTVRQYAPGETIVLHVLRGEEKLQIKATLGARPADPGSERRDMQNMLGGPLSKRRQGFLSALQHDTVLRPSECGGPLCDLDGAVVGINIARAGRVESYAIPADLVIAFVNESKEALAANPNLQPELTPAERLAALQQSIESLEARMKGASSAREAADKALAASREALEKAEAARQQANDEIDAIKRDLEKALLDKIELEGDVND